MENSIRASVIIVTYNGGKKINGLLTALLKQTVTDFEVIIVIDGSTDNTIEIVKPYLNRFKQIQVIEQENQGRARVRNAGSRKANSTLLIFYDDDMIPDCNSVKRHIEFHANHCGILTGNQVEFVQKDKTDIQNYKARLTKCWIKKHNDIITKLGIENLFFTASNASFTITLFKELVGFDESLTDGEDRDIAIRALKKGISVFFDKENIAIHNESITCRSYIKRQREYAKAQKKIQALHSDCIKVTNEKYFLKRILYRLVAFSFLVSLVDSGFLKFIMPKSIRYKFYDVTIQAMGIEYPEIAL